MEDKEREKAPNRFKDEDLEVILYGYLYQSKTQLAEALNVTQQCISKRLIRIGMVHKKGNWLLHDLTERAIVHRKAMCKSCLKGTK